MDELMLSNLKDAGLFYVSPAAIQAAIEKAGHDFVNSLITDFKTIREKAKDCKTHQSRKSNDVIYSKAYQRLVRLDLCPQIKQKYR